MSIKDFLRNYCAKGCLMYKRLEQIRKKKYLTRFCQPYSQKIPFLNEFVYTKKSDTFFILGSGSSVNDLTDADWQTVRKHDSAGFNLWLVHDFVPDFYMFETAERDSEWAVMQRTQDFFYNLRMKEDCYKDVKLIYKMNNNLSQHVLMDAELSPEILKNIYYSPVIFLAYHNVESMRKSLKAAVSIMKRNKHWLHFHAITTAFDLILFAIKYKFKKIVLVGIDLTADYFYETPAFEAFARIKNLKVPQCLTTPEEFASGINAIESGLIGTVQWHNVPLSVIIDEIDKTILQPSGIQLYVSSKKSRLSSRYPCYFDSHLE